MDSTSLFLWFQLLTHGVGPVLIPQDVIWIKLTKVYKEMLHTKNLCSIRSSFREEEFWSWSSFFLCSNLWNPGWGQFLPKEIIWIKLIKVHKQMLNTKCQSSSPSSFREEFWSWFSLFVCSNLWPQGQGQFWPHKHHTNKLGRGPQGFAKNQISKLYAFHFLRGEEFWRGDSLFLCSNLWPLGWGQSWPQEHHVNKLGRGQLEDATYQISKL